ncbi:hypothetical protein FACS189426_06220 [Bacteroidia bacterium]|nr:hypothetical protein FACS189426_06220 [Bacteroidia bacterium]GHV71230.1 hypothetical protein FACS189420_5550 [Bacteroidia bacterium]
MFGLKIISSKKLERMNNLDESFRGIIDGKEAQIKSLENQVSNQNDVIAKLQLENNILSEKLAKFDRKRVNGRFVKATI